MINRKKILIIGANSDLAKAAIKILNNNFEVIKLGSKELDLSKTFEANKLKLNFEHLIFFSAINQKKKFIKYSNEEIEKHYKINFLNLSLLIKNIIPVFMKKKSVNKIILISSLYSLFGRSERLPYSISKFALNGLGKNLAVEYGKYGILTNLVIPGFVDTKLTKKNINPTDLKKIKSKTPTNSLVTKKQIAEVINFLISDKSNGINGQTIVVDGGLSSNGDFS